MKILLTGLPKSGKTTLLSELIPSVPQSYGMVACEDTENGQRTGFSLLDSQGRRAMLATSNQVSDYPVGCFFVDVSSLDSFSARLFEFSPRDFLYIDEIGQMQLYSGVFRRLVNSYVASGNDYLGTASLIYEDVLIDRVKSRTDVLVCMVTPENRASLKETLSEALARRSIFNALPIEQQQTVLGLARHYLANNQYISLRKLFHNALRYVSEHRVVKQSEGIYTVNGDHSDYRVQEIPGGYRCTCNFFNDIGEFKGYAGECSHIQSLKIMAVSLSQL